MKSYIIFCFSVVPHVIYPEHCISVTLNDTQAGYQTRIDV